MEKYDLIIVGAGPDVYKRQILYCVVVTVQIFLVYFCFNMLYHGTNVGVPMWVADMNFPTVPTIQEAIIERTNHPAFGYFNPTDEYLSLIHI